MSDKELKQEEFEATYQIQDLLGKGAFAKVNKVVNIKDSACQEYAVKIIDLKDRSTKKIEKRKRELLFVELEHPNIVKFFHYSFTTSVKDGGKILDLSLACSSLNLYIRNILIFTLYFICKHLFQRNYTLLWNYVLKAWKPGYTTVINKPQTFKRICAM